MYFRIPMQMEWEFGLDWLDQRPRNPALRPQSKFSNLLLRSWKMGEKMGKNQFSIEFFL